jgi:predicted PurR-regulated permease PerM
MRLSIVVLILVLVVGSIVIFLGVLANQEYVQVSEISNQYENLEKYKNELEKINQYNQQILESLEKQIKNSTDIHLDQINEEILVIKQVVNENKEELERVIEKLSQIESEP